MPSCRTILLDKYCSISSVVKLSSCKILDVSLPCSGARLLPLIVSGFLPLIIKGVLGHLIVKPCGVLISCTISRDNNCGCSKAFSCLCGSDERRGGVEW